MDGVELTRHIRHRQDEEDTTIILTTYNWDDIMEEALDAGVDAFLAKPLFAGNIRQEITRILSDKKERTPAPKVSLAGRRVILAEDMDINAEIMKQILNMKDIITDMVGDGQKACELFESSAEGTYDAILMDIRMPKKNGLEATRQIREMECVDAKTIPIIALTANTFDEDVQLSLDAGMNGPATFEAIKNMDTAKNTSVLFRTGMDDAATSDIMSALNPAGVIPKSEGTGAQLKAVADHM